MDEINASSLCSLGQKEYWESFYTKELDNFEDYGDEGDIWFGKKNFERIVSWMVDNKIDTFLPILDVGCGNGMSLVSLGKKGYKDLTGIDYAKEAIQLAENVAKIHNINIKFQVLDFLKDEECLDLSILKQEYYIIIDKGTYDAICLCQTDSETKKQKYVERIKQLLRLDGFFILFSCNWTKTELLRQFNGFTIHDEIEIPSIAFGGETGQTVTAVILKKETLIPTCIGLKEEFCKMFSVD